VTVASSDIGSFKFGKFLCAPVGSGPTFIHPMEKVMSYRHRRLFFQSNDPQEIFARYREHLGMEQSWEDGVTLQWRDARAA
jgi:hypothetical protein